MTRKMQLSKQSVSPTMQSHQAIPLLRRQIERLEEIVRLNYDDPKITAWESTTENILNAVYGLSNGELHRNTADFKYACGGQLHHVGMSDAEIQRDFVLTQQKRKA